MIKFVFLWSLTSASFVDGTIPLPRLDIVVLLYEKYKKQADGAQRPHACSFYKALTAFVARNGLA